MEDLQTLKLILLVFGHLPRLGINLKKSTLSDVNISQDQISRLALVLECAISYLPLTYLGLPLGGNLRSNMFWDSMVDRISMRLDKWEDACL